MQEQDLQQISNLLDEKFKENNKELKNEIYKKIDDAVIEITSTVNDAFQEVEEGMEKRFNKVDQELAKRPTKDELSGWRDEQAEPVERDVDKLKYIHRHEWRNLPDSGEISRELTLEGLKN